MVKTIRKERVSKASLNTRTVEVLETAIDNPHKAPDPYAATSSCYTFREISIPRQERVVLPVLEYSIGDTLRVNLKTKEAGIALTGSSQAIVIGVTRNSNNRYLEDELVYPVNSYLYEIEIGGFRMKLNDPRVESVELIRPVARKKITVVEKRKHEDVVAWGQG